VAPNRRPVCASVSPAAHSRTISARRASVNRPRPRVAVAACRAAASVTHAGLSPTFARPDARAAARASPAVNWWAVRRSRAALPPFAPAAAACSRVNFRPAASACTTVGCARRAWPPTRWCSTRRPSLTARGTRGA
jgi:hypothetical protein